MSGQPVIKGTRFPVKQLLAEMQEGRTLQEIAKEFDISAKLLSNCMVDLCQQAEKFGWLHVLSSIGITEIQNSDFYQTFHSMSFDDAIAKVMKLYRQYKRNNPNQRFGQYFCNELNITDSLIFYQENDGKVLSHIADRLQDIDIERQNNPNV
jgi:hypothetical protein